jgi:hypothetical protein
VREYSLTRLPMSMQFQRELFGQHVTRVVILTFGSSLSAKVDLQYY